MKKRKRDYKKRQTGYSVIQRVHNWFW